MRSHGCLLGLALTQLAAGCEDRRAPADHDGGQTQTTASSSTTAPGSSTTTTTTTQSDDTTTSPTSATTGSVRPKFDIGGRGTDGPDIDPPPFPTTCEEAAEHPSSVGCEFYPLNVPGAGGPSAKFIASNVSGKPAYITFSNRQGLIKDIVVPPNKMVGFDGSPQEMAPGQGMPATSVGELGYAIESDQVLQVWMIMPIQVAATNDASIVFPGPSLGIKHRVVTYNDKITEGPTHYVAVVATEDLTDVTFTLVSPGSTTEPGNAIPALDKDSGPESTTVTLNRLQTWLIGGVNQDPDTEIFINDFTGSLVESTKPVAVYSGNTCSFTPDCGTLDCCCCDLITDAVPPTTTYGKEYAGVKLLPLGEDKDLWRFIGNKDGTVVNLEGGLERVIWLDAGQHVDVETAEVFWASGNHPFGLVHFMTSGKLAGFSYDNPFQPYDCDPIQSPGDPAITWAFPHGNWLTRYLFPTGTSVSGEWCHDHITVTGPMDSWDAITLNGELLPPPTEIGTKGIGYVYIPAPDGKYELLAPDDVGLDVSVYGYSHHGSYLYPGGVGLRALNPEG